MKSKRDKCKKYSTRWKRLNKTVDKLYHRRREQIKSMCYSIAHYLASKYDYVVIGDYTPNLKTAKEKGMHRSMLNQTTIGQFRKILEWVMTKSGKHYKMVNERNTTKSCCICSHQKVKDPSIRQFKCERCHTSIHRDINSSINIAKKAKLLSGSDYVKWDLSQITYTAKWDYRKSKILFAGYVS